VHTTTRCVAVLISENRRFFDDLVRLLAPKVRRVRLTTRTHLRRQLHMHRLLLVDRAQQIAEPCSGS
jgi:hypothetical protein